MASRSGHAGLFNIVLPSIVQQRLDEWSKNSVSIRIFVTGKTGAGKSTLVNGVVGHPGAVKVGSTLKPETTKVEARQFPIDKIQVTIWDSPGLQDVTAKEAEYLDDIKRNCTDIDLFIYCMSMSEARFVDGGADIVAMQKLTKTLGADIWQNALIVLTFANDFVTESNEKYDDDTKKVKEAYEKKVEEWKDKIRKKLHSQVGLPLELVSSIEVVAAGHPTRPQILPDGDYWLSKLWMSALHAVKKDALPALIKINQHRFKTMTEIDQLHLSSHLLIHEQPLIYTEKGFQLGTELGVSHIGAAVGLAKGLGKSIRDSLMLYFARRHQVNCTS